MNTLTKTYHTDTLINEGSTMEENDENLFKELVGTPGATTPAIETESPPKMGQVRPNVKGAYVYKVDRCTHVTYSSPIHFFQSMIPPSTVLASRPVMVTHAQLTHALETALAPIRAQLDRLSEQIQEIASEKKNDVTEAPTETTCRPPSPSSSSRSPSRPATPTPPTSSSSSPRPPLPSQDAMALMIAQMSRLMAGLEEMRPQPTTGRNDAPTTTTTNEKNTKTTTPPASPRVGADPTFSSTSHPTSTSDKNVASAPPPPSPSPPAPFHPYHHYNPQAYASPLATPTTPHVGANPVPGMPSVYPPTYLSTAIATAPPPPPPPPGPGPGPGPSFSAYSSYPTPPPPPPPPPSITPPPPPPPSMPPPPPPPPSGGALPSSSRSTLGVSLTVEDVVREVTSMGFAPFHVRETIATLAQEGGKLEVNVIIDRLMKGGDG